MKKALILLFLAISTSGCSTLSRKTQIVYIPTPVKCEPSVKIEPITDYPFDHATKEMSMFEKYQLASAERKLLRGENVDLRAALSECTN